MKHGNPDSKLPFGKVRPCTVYGPTEGGKAGAQEEGEELERSKTKTKYKEQEEIGARGAGC